MELPQAAKNIAHRTALVSAMAGLLYLAYLFTFSGTFKTGDERLLLDVANSLVLQQSNYTSQTADIWGLMPVTIIEPGQPLLVAPLYWTAYHLPFVGNIHAILLFNLVVTVVTAIVLFYYSLELGYTDRTAVIGALLFGLTTIAWPYAPTFFREPLASLMLLATAFSLEKWRRAFLSRENRQWKWLVTSVLVSIGALLTKEASLMALPLLVIFAYPGSVSFKKHWRTFAAIGIGLVLAAVLLAIILLTVRAQVGTSMSRYHLVSRLVKLARGLPEAWIGIAGFMLSPGKGIWWYSPILLLALGAPFVLPRNRWRESWFPLILTLWFAVSYAAAYGPVMWSTGAGWGPRYMVPLTPIIMLAALPLIDRMLNSAHWWPRVALVLLSLYGLLVQIGGAYVNLYSYYGHIESGTGHFVWEGPAIWTFRWSQAIGSFLFIPQAKTDIMWLTPSVNWIMLGLLSFGIVLSVGAMIWLLRQPTLAPRSRAVFAIIGPALAIVITVIAFRFARDDPRYQVDIPELESLRVYLSQNTGKQDVIMLSTPTYSRYFLNWYKGKAIWYNLPTSPGERSSWEQEPAVVSDKVEELISPHSVKIFEENLQGGSLYRGGPLWLVVDSSPFHPWSTRPPEWYLAKYTYPVGVTEFSPTVRLAEYLPLEAPDASATPTRSANAMFGENIELVGFDLATNSDDTTLGRGDMLGVSLLWEAAGPVAIDYTVGMYLLDPGGAVSLQQDRQPVGGFAPTSRWKQGEPLRDNYGFIIPQDLAPGEYKLAMTIYDWTSMERLIVVGPDGMEQGDLFIIETLFID